VNTTELKCYDWLNETYKVKPEFNPIRHTFVVKDKIYSAKTLQGDRILVTRSDTQRLKGATIAVFSIGSKPVSIFQFNDIDFTKHKSPGGIKVYIVGAELARGISLTTSQYEEITRTKELIENDFGKRYSFGDIVHVLCIAYATGRSVVMRESQPIIVTPDEQMEQSLDQNV
jgi:hypothetical protein